MSNIDLETLRTAYEAAHAELDMQPRAAQIAERAVVAAQSALVDAMMGRLREPLRPCAIDRRIVIGPVGFATTSITASPRRRQYVGPCVFV